MKNRQGRFVVLSADYPVYNELDQAVRETEVLLLENPENKYFIAELVAATASKVTFVQFDKGRTTRKPREKKEPSYSMEDLASTPRCEFDNNLAVKSILMADGTTKHLCAEHVK